MGSIIEFGHDQSSYIELSMFDDDDESISPDFPQDISMDQSTVELKYFNC